MNWMIQSAYGWSSEDVSGQANFRVGGTLFFDFKMITFEVLAPWIYKMEAQMS